MNITDDDFGTIISTIKKTNESNNNIEIHDKLEELLVFLIKLRINFLIKKYKSNSKKNKNNIYKNLLFDEVNEFLTIAEVHKSYELGHCFGCLSEQYPDLLDIYMYINTFVGLNMQRNRVYTDHEDDPSLIK